jgi:hypothetical protein
MADEEVNLANFLLPVRKDLDSESITIMEPSKIQHLSSVLIPTTIKFPMLEHFLNGVMHLRLNNNQGAIQDYNQAIYLTPRRKSLCISGVKCEPINTGRIRRSFRGGLTAAVARNRHDAARSRSSGISAV